MPKREIGSRLKKLRELIGFEKGEVADYLNISVDTLNQIENNEETFDTSILNKFCNLYNCSPGYIVYGDENEYNPLKIQHNSSEKIDLNVIALINEARRYYKLLYKLNHS